jgi:hypothetical protein
VLYKLSTETYELFNGLYRKKWKKEGVEGRKSQAQLSLKNRAFISNM